MSNLDLYQQKWLYDKESSVYHRRQHQWLSSRKRKSMGRHHKHKDLDSRCSMEIVETIPEVLKRAESYQMTVQHRTIQKAWLRLLALANQDFAIVSQWGIGKSGRGVEFYNASNSFY